VFAKKADDDYELLAAPINAITATLKDNANVSIRKYILSI
jgi:hypothetical protein